jgi:serine protease Do
MFIDNGLFKTLITYLGIALKSANNTIKKYSKTFTVLLAVVLSTVVNSYYRPIQESVHDGINWIYEKNEIIGEALYETNGFIFNGKFFDQERKAKYAIWESYSSVVIVSVASDNNEANKSMAGRGTGFFIEVTDEYALVATNHHVIDQHLKNKEFKIKIQTPTNMWDYEAEVIGADPVSDVAVVKIYKQDNEEWKALEFAQHTDYNVGDPIVVIGHGMSMPWTSTQGTISYKDRYGSRPYSLMLQVDAVINQGNSGGPVIDMNGEVIGIAQSIYSPGRQIPGWDGVGMAVPAKQAIRAIDYILSPQYKAKGYVPYAEFPFMLGTFELKDVLDIPKEERRYAFFDYTNKKETDKDTVGEASGLLQGDILVSLNGEDVFNSFYVMRQTVYAFPGDEWDVVVNRNGEFVNIKIALREMDMSKILASLNRGR